MWEWTDTIRGAGGRITRGGGWYDSEISEISTASRASAAERRRAADLGFRCAKSL